MANLEIILYTHLFGGRADVESDVINRGRTFTWRRVEEIRPADVQIVTFFKASELRTPKTTIAPRIVEHFKGLVTLSDAERIAIDITDKIKAAIDDQGEDWRYQLSERFIEQERARQRSIQPLADFEKELLEAGPDAPLTQEEQDILFTGKLTINREANKLL